MLIHNYEEDIMTEPQQTDPNVDEFESVEGGEPDVDGEPQEPIVDDDDQTEITDDTDDSEDDDGIDVPDSGEGGA